MEIIFINAFTYSGESSIALQKITLAGSNPSLPNFTGLSSSIIDAPEIINPSLPEAWLVLFPWKQQYKAHIF